MVQHSPGDASSDDDSLFDPQAAAEATHCAAQIYERWLSGLEGRRVAPDVDFEALTRDFANTLGDEGVGMARVLDEFAERVEPNAMGTPHPRYWGLVNSSPLPMAPVADLLVSMLNNNSGAFHQSPPSTAAELEVCRLFASVLGLDPEVRGMMLPGGSYANLQGLMLARAWKFPDARKQGPRALPDRARLYCSEAVHFSASRGGHLLGIGEENVVAIRGTGRGEMDVDALRDQVAADRAAGAVPFCLVGTLGTTGTGAVDDLEALADLCGEHEMWFHVDACYGGKLALLEETADLCRGIERGDSVAVDPHKAFFQPITAGLLFTRHPHLEKAAFGVDASYIPGAGDDAYVRGVPTSRRGTPLAVWLTLRAHGLEPVRAAARRNHAQMRRVEQLLDAGGFRVLPEGRLSVACARCEPEGASPADLDDLQLRISQDVQRSGVAWFGTTRLNGQTWLRFNAVNLHTRDRHVDEVARAVLEAAAALTT